MSAADETYDGGPAYPQQTRQPHPKARLVQVVTTHPGMSVRQVYIAACAQVVFAQANERGLSIARRAENVVDMADALLHAERFVIVEEST